MEGPIYREAIPCSKMASLQITLKPYFNLHAFNTRTRTAKKKKTKNAYKIVYAEILIICPSLYLIRNSMWLTQQQVLLITVHEEPEDEVQTIFSHNLAFLDYFQQ